MQKKEEIIENFKTAIKSTIKSLSNNDNLEISFGGQEISVENNKLRLPEINEYQNKINFNLTRAQADSESLKLRYSDKKILKSFEPAGSKARKLYEIAEKIRYETIFNEKNIFVKSQGIFLESSLFEIQNVSNSAKKQKNKFWFCSNWEQVQL